MLCVADQASPESWEPVDLTKVLSDDWEPAKPSVGQRDDGWGLFYPGRTHTVASEPEGGKTWLALAVAQQEMTKGNKVVFIDYEDTPDGVIGRLRSLGMSAEEIQEKFIYIRPETPAPHPDRLRDLVEQFAPSLVVIDGVTEAMTKQDLNLLDNQDVASFFDQLPTPLTLCGSAVVLLDHEVKRTQDRGRFAIGAGHKLAAVTGAAYRLRRIAPFGVGQTGTSEIRVTKDRPGQIRRRLLDDKAEGLFAFLEISSEGSDHARARITTRAVEQARSSHLKAVKERIVAAMEQMEFTTKGEIKKRVQGNSQVVSDALNQLIDERVITNKPYRVVQATKSAS